MAVLTAANDAQGISSCTDTTLKMNLFSWYGRPQAENALMIVVEALLSTHHRFCYQIIRHTIHSVALHSLKQQDHRDLLDQKIAVEHQHIHAGLDEETPHAKI